MAYFDADNGGGGSVNPVYLKVEGSSLLEIFPTSYHTNMPNALIGSPTETGEEWLDNKVIQPITIELTGIVKYPKRQVFQKIRQNMRKHTLKDILCTFYSKAGYYENMLIKQLEESGESNKYDGIIIKVSLHEYLEHGKNHN